MKAQTRPDTKDATQWLDCYRFLAWQYAARNENFRNKARGLILAGGCYELTQIPRQFGCYSIVDHVANDYLHGAIPKTHKDASQYVRIVHKTYTPVELDCILDAFYSAESNIYPEHVWFVYESIDFSKRCPFRFTDFYEYPPISSQYLIANCNHYGRLAFPNWYSVPYGNILEPSFVEDEGEFLTFRLKLHGEKWQRKMVMALHGLADLIANGGWMGDIETYLLKFNAGGNFRHEQWASRTIGLWLWDYVQDHGGKKRRGIVQEAIEGVKELLKPLSADLGYYAGSPDRVLQGLFNRTEKCIEACEVLSFK